MIDKNTRLLSICCTFRRPEHCQEMLKTFYETRSPGTEILLYCHLDDPHLESYRTFLDKHDHVIDRHRCMQEVLNYVVFELHPEIPYYQVMVDDGRYLTKGWDNMLISALEKTKGWGFACAHDLVNGDKWHLSEHPSMEIWSWKQSKTMGYAYPRNFRQTGMDFYAKDLGKSLNALTLVDGCAIRHMWWDGCAKEKDDNLKENYSSESMAYAHKAYQDWVKNERDEALRKIREAQKNER